MRSLTEQVDAAIAARQLLGAGESVMVAVSGGADSMVLLHLLSGSTRRHGWSLSVAHFNHQLRGRASEADARLVQRTCEKLGIRCKIGTADVKAFARARKLSIEMAARELRHAFLADTAAKFDVRKIAVAHHADDQVELFLLRMLRGSSTLGLGGMHWASPSPANPSLTLIRPLLDTPKADIVAYARENKVNYREDATNSVTNILRNRIRHELLPLLRREYQAGVDAVLFRQSDLLREDADLLVKETQHWLALGTPAFPELPPALQRRVLHFRLLEAGIQPDFALVERLRQSPGVWISVSAQLICRAARTGEIETSMLEREQTHSENSVVVNLTKKSAELDGVLLSWAIAPADNLLKWGKETESFDADQVGDRIILRHWRAGDRFQPIGMRAPVKLQDLFVNNKIPRSMRSKLTIAATAKGDIFWVERLRISENYKISATTRRRLIWTWRRTTEIAPEDLR